MEEADLSMADLTEMSRPGAKTPQPDEVNKLKVTGRKSGSVKASKQQSARDDAGDGTSRYGSYLNLRSLETECPLVCLTILPLFSHATAVGMSV